jgi:CrcB protein
VRQSISVAVVALGGAFGSVLRYVVSLWFVQRFGPGFPWGTFTINVTGSFAIGVVLQLAASRADFSPYVRLLLATGVLGGYTTFSAYAFETYNLGSSGSAGRALAYALGSVVAGVAAAYFGVVAARLASPS